VRLSVFLTKAEALVRGQDEERWLALALNEIECSYADDVPSYLREWVLGRARALWEEDQ